MRLALFTASLAALLTTVAWITFDGPSPPPVREGVPESPRVERGHAVDPADTRSVDRLDFRLTLRRDVSVGAHTVAPLTLTADVRRVPLARPSGRFELALDAVALSGPSGTPLADDVRDAFHVARTAGHGLQVGFEPPVTPEARELLGTVVSAIQFTPGAGDRWRVLEEDVNGRYEAQYERLSATVVERSRRYVALRTPLGFEARRADQVSVSGRTTFEHDARGLVRVHLDEVATFDIGDSQRIRAATDLRLERADATQVAARAGAMLPLEALSQAGAEGDVNRDAAILGDHTAESLIAAFDELADLPARSHETSKWRNTQLLRLRALVRTDPEAADTLARAVLERAGAGDPVVVDLLVGGLAQSQTPAGREALLTLADDRLLDRSARRRVALGLGRLEEPTPETGATLGQMLEEGGMGSVPALALGSQARALADSEPDAAQDAVDRLIEGYLAAPDWSQKRPYLSALGNAGDVRALPLLHEALTTPLATTAAYSLRLIPGEQADALLMGIVGSPGGPRVRAAAVAAIGVRSPMIWRPILAELREVEADPTVLQTIDRMLALMPSS